MPVYDYKCPECGHVEEDVTVTLKDLDIAQWFCTKCGEQMLRVVGNNGGFRLKGSRWSHDGYADTWGDAQKFKGGQ